MFPSFSIKKFQHTRSTFRAFFLLSVVLSLILYSLLFGLPFILLIHLFCCAYLLYFWASSIDPFLCLHLLLISVFHVWYSFFYSLHCFCFFRISCYQFIPSLSFLFWMISFTDITSVSLGMFYFDFIVPFRLYLFIIPFLYISLQPGSFKSVILQLRHFFGFL